MTEYITGIIITKTCKICNKEFTTTRNTNGKLYCDTCKDSDEYKKIKHQYTLESGRKWKRNNIERHRKISRDYASKLKVTVMEHYGSKCSCCGDTNMEFLTIDHINGFKNSPDYCGKPTRGWKTYLYLIKNNYPEGYRVLCMNCNFSYGQFGYCPHNKSG